MSKTPNWDPTRLLGGASPSRKPKSPSDAGATWVTRPDDKTQPPPRKEKAKKADQTPAKKK